MKEIELKIGFTTPAFLGNASQNSQWRTPPFKALLRQWWRVVKAKDVGYDYKTLLAAENELFGKAADEGKSTRSALRLRLNNWDVGKLATVTQGEKVIHREVKDNKGQLVPIGSNLYLGYGPITTRGIKNENHAIAPSDETATLWIGFPDCFYQEIKRTIQLFAWFGTAGSRSRNGWGSITVGDAKEKDSREKDFKNMELHSLTSENLQQYCKNYSECLALDWVHAIGKDKIGPLVWQTEPKESWEAVMKELAEIKIEFRTQFIFPEEKPPHQRPCERHVISYPVTNHACKDLEHTKRLANQVRFKVVTTSNNKYRGIIIHLPCKAPEDQFLDPKNMRSENIELFRKLEKEVWPKIHQKIGEKLTRVSANSRR